MSNHAFIEGREHGTKRTLTVAHLRRAQELVVKLRPRTPQESDHAAK